MGRHLGLVLKTVERCNLNCSYCYFFNGHDQSFKSRPKFMSRQTVDHLVNFINSSIDYCAVDSLRVTFHGGEPLMQPKNDFEYICNLLRDKIGPQVGDLSFSLQTNATLVTPKWIQMLNKHKVSVGVSIDGPKKYHDMYRVDHYGNGSYESVVRGIKLLQDGLLRLPGCLAVINPNIPPKEYYQHIIDLGFQSLDLILPDNNHDNLPPEKIKSYSDFMIGVFDEWIKADNPKITIRKFRSIILQLLGKAPLVYGFGKISEDRLPILGIRSDGDIAPTDELMSTDPELTVKTGMNVRTHSMQDVLQYPIFNELKETTKNVPTKCSKCCWYQACGSGGIVNRYSKENKFNNHSVYCEGLKDVFSHVSAYLIKSGVKYEQIVENLKICA